ncbi:RNA polymerase subunit sigma-24 [Dyadobacter luteus]|uniref:RNA polymerase subunit sigma-24 n=1 Tax=Dyadobacter luteus TaxID=2259619 RepID=A0A3D8Y5Z0_9BACT|nr:RNA polymerase sigma factor [Dyadobacter luteus]REA58088.1 RNA polymerase subunit sigma-24 [Dyadobacter luteus]
MNLFKKRSTGSLADIIEGCRRQERRAQNTFFDHYKNKLKGLCFRYAKTEAEADDILQESFIKIFKNIDQLRDAESVDGWVKSLVVRTAINYYHATTKKELLSTSIELNVTDIELNDSCRIIDQLDMEVLLKTLNSLPDGYRTVVNLYLIDGYTHQQIGEMLGISEGTSKSQLQRGRVLLMKKLQKTGIEDYEYTGRKS